MKIKPRYRHIPTGFIFLCILLLICSVSLLSLVPPISRDALVHHLAVPKLYLQHGGFYEIPEIVFSYYPMNLDLLYMVSLAFSNDIIPKFIHSFFGLLSAWITYSYLKKKLNSVYGLFGVVFFLSIPIIIKLSISVYVDLGLVFFSTASLLLLLRWAESGFKWKYLLFSAVSCGLALGVKYNALVVFLILSLLVPLISSRLNQHQKTPFSRHAIRGFIFIFVALLLFSPWMIRNWHWTANPIYPLHDSFLNPPEKITQTMSVEKKADEFKLDIFSYRSLVYKEKNWEIALLPIRIFFQGKDGNAKKFDGKLNPFLLILPIFAFLPIPTRRKNKNMNERLVLLVFSLLYFVLASLTTVMRVRYLVPMLPPLVILSVYGLHDIIEWVQLSHSKKIRLTGSILVTSSLLFLFSWNVKYIVDQFSYVSPLEYITGKIDRDSYITKYRPEYPVMQYINSNLPQNADILFIHIGNRGYYCDKKYQYDRIKGRSTIQKLTKKAISSLDLLHKLRKTGNTHLLLNQYLFSKNIQDNYTPEEQQKIAAFFQHFTRLLTTSGSYALFELNKSPEKSNN